MEVCMGILPQEGFNLTPAYLGTTCSATLVFAALAGIKVRS
jgi:hypothetical protein